MNAVTPRQAQQAAEILGDERTARIVGAGGLSGAPMRDLVRIVNAAAKFVR